MLSAHEAASHTKVKAAETGVPPKELEVVKDMRGNPRTRRQLIEGFWKGQRGISAHVGYVANESDRERLRKQGRVMVHISNLSAEHVDIIGAVSLFQAE